MGKMDGQHTVMPRSLAEELMRAGMKHFDQGGTLTSGVPQPTPQSTQSNFGAITNNDITNPGGVFGGNNSTANQILNPIGAFGGSLLGMTQDNFQAANPNITTQNLTPQIQNLQGQNQSVYNQQQSLANTLLQQSQGQGPNVAQNQLNQATANNVANQGALMAGQRGAGSNVGLIARQAAQQGANTQQQAVGQAATLGAQQQLAAQQALQTQQSNMANQSLQGQSIAQGAQASQNTAINQGVLGAEGINAGVSATNSQATNGLIGGLLGGGGSALSSIFYKGGKVQKFDTGGDVNDQVGIENFTPQTTPNTNYFTPPSAQSSSGGKSGGGGGGIMALAALLAKGGPVPGKAPFPGKNTPKNDIQPAMLTPGEEVLPLSVTKAKDAPEKAKEFVAHLQKKDKSKKGYEGVASSKKSLEERVKHLERLCGGGYA